MRVELTDDPTAFRARPWGRAVAASPWGTFFHTPEYLKLWWEEFGGGRLAIALADDRGEPAGACCFEVRKGTLTFLGGFDVTDYMGPVSLPGMERRVASGLIEATGRLEWDRADLRGLPEGSPWLPALEGAGTRAGLAVHESDDGVAPFIALPEDHDRYLAALPSKLRHEIGRKERRLAQEAGPHRIAVSTRESAPSDLDRFLDLHRDSPGPKGKFMHAGMEIFFRRLAEAFVPRHVFHLAFLEIGGERVAGAVGFGFKETFSLYNSAFDRRFASLSPGMVLVGDLIRLAIESGRTTFDLLKGDLAYKYRFGATARRVRRLVLER